MAHSFSEYLGILVRTHGVDGSLVVADTAGLQATLGAGSIVAVGYTRDFAEPKTLAAYQQQGERIILRFTDIDTPEGAAELVEKAVYVQASDVGVVEDDRYAIGEIEGCTAVDGQGAPVGTVTEVWLLPANDVWVITTPQGNTIPLPVHDQTVLAVDLPARMITVNIPEGLVDIDKPSPGEESDA